MGVGIHMLKQQGEVDAVKQDFFSRLTQDLVLPGEILPGQSLIELAGDGRVLIENHGGVTEYSRCRIGAGVSFGQVVVCGDHLELAQMTRQQLVIVGKISSVTLVKGRQP